MKASTALLEEMGTWLQRTFPDADCQVQILHPDGGQSYLILMLDFGHPEWISASVAITKARDAYTLIEYFKQGIEELQRMTGRK
jgi:hypothetical protein